MAPAIQAPVRALPRCGMISLAPAGKEPDCEALGVHDESMGPIMVRLRGHGDDRQPAVRLDAVCSAHGESSRGATLAPFRCPMGIWAVRRGGNVEYPGAGAV